VQPLVGLVVDGALVPLSLEVVERPQQEVALTLELGAGLAGGLGHVGHHR
jgi:hypothetical protein